MLEDNHEPAEWFVVFGGVYTHTGKYTHGVGKSVRVRKGLTFAGWGGLCSKNGSLHLSGRLFCSNVSRYLGTLLQWVGVRSNRGEGHMHADRLL